MKGSSHLDRLFLLSVSVLFFVVFENTNHVDGFSSSPVNNSIFPRSAQQHSSKLSMSSTSTKVPSWNDLQTLVGETAVGSALNKEVKLRTKGKGSAHVQNKLRLFDAPEGATPPITLYRDHAGWCPYCQKTMLLVEEKQIPLQIDLVPMRSYGDKPTEFMRKVPGGLLPAIEVQGQIITESAVIMDLLDQWHPAEDGYKPMMPPSDDVPNRQRYQMLASKLFLWT